MQTKAIYTTWEYGKGQEKLTYNKTLFSQNDQVPQLKVQLAGASEVTVSGRATFVMPDGSTVSTLHISNTNNMLVFNIPPVALTQIGEHNITVETSTDTFNFTIPIPIKYVVNSSANIDCSSAIPPSDVTYVTDILNVLQQQINIARDMLDEVNTTINTAKEIADGLVLKIVETGDTQQARLEEFTQAKIKEINDEGLKLEITQNAHGFTLNAVQYDKASGVYTKANAETGADAIAVRIDDNKFYLMTNGFIEIPANAVDSKGNPYELDEYYFLDNEVAGGCTPEKPIHIFQALFCVVNKKGVKSALVEIGDPIDLNPRILVDEINSLGLVTTDQVVLSEPTVADLIASKKYKVGDVVQVLGYYTKGDGGGHPRQKKPVGYNGADAVIGVDGSIWGIVTKGLYRLSWIGFSSTDSSKNTEAIQTMKNILIQETNQDLILEVDLDSMWWNYDEPFTLFEDGVSPPSSFIKKNLTFRGVGKRRHITWAFSGENSRFMCVNSPYMKINVENLTIMPYQINWSSNSTYKGYVFYFNSVQVGDNYLGYTTNNLFKDVTVKSYGIGSGKLHPVKAIFHNIGYGQNDQTLVQNCEFEHFGKCYVGQNPEAVNWVFDRCGFVSQIQNSVFFEFTSLFDNFLVKDCSFSLYGNINSALVKTIHTIGDDKSYGALFSVLFDSSRFELYGNGSFIWSNLELLKVTFRNCNNKLAGFDGTIENYIKKDGSLEFDNCILRKANYTLFKKNPIVSGLESNAKLKFINSTLDDYSIILNNNDVVAPLCYYHEVLWNSQDYGIVEFINSSYTNRDSNLNFKLNLQKTLTETNNNVFITTGNNVGLGKKILIPPLHSLKNLYLDVGLVPYSKIILVFMEGTPQENVLVIDNVNYNTKSKKDFNVISDKIITQIYSGSSMRDNVLAVYLGNNSTDRYVDITTSLKLELKNSIKVVSSISENNGFFIEQFQDTTISTLDTPYHATQMSKLGILDSYHGYLTELHEYEKSQNVPEGIMNLNVVQPPVIPKEIEEYAKEYNLI